MSILPQHLQVPMSLSLTRCYSSQTLAHLLPMLGSPHPVTPRVKPHRGLFSTAITCLSPLLTPKMPCSMRRHQTLLLEYIPYCGTWPVILYRRALQSLWELLAHQTSVQTFRVGFDACLLRSTGRVGYALVTISCTHCELVRNVWLWGSRISNRCTIEYS